MSPVPVPSLDVGRLISYAAQDKPVADAACAVLERLGLRCWIAPRDATPGLEWSAQIIRAINEAAVMVLIYSRNANASQQVKREVERAVLTATIQQVPWTMSLPFLPNGRFELTSRSEDSGTFSVEDGRWFLHSERGFPQKRHVLRASTIARSQ